MSVSEAEKTARLFRRNIYNLLGRPLKAKTQYQHPATGQWKYKPLKRIEPSEFYAHLKGRTTIALCPIAEFATVVGRFALFVCWDIDERFRDRLDIMRQVLTGRGYAGGAFAVTGSDEGRGKVVLCRNLSSHLVPGVGLE